MQPYYVTTAIAYPNAAPHVGHAYEYIATDAIARFKRLDGFDVRFLTGTDEHGLKVAQAAAAAGVPTAQLARRNSDVFQRMQEALNISFDRFIRTTDPDHYAASQEIWRRMEAAGDLYLDNYSGWYSVRDERFFVESETQLVDGTRIAIETGTPVTWTEEQTYFFRLSAYADKLLAHYHAHPDFIAPEVRRNEVISFVSGGLKDLSVSRTSFNWGVPVPEHPDHVMYVWVDALTNYLTGAGYPDTGSESFRRYWPADLHMIGKDIIRFHAVYWPAFLMSAGIELPRKVFAHGFLHNRGEKMSKSVGNVIDPVALIQAYGVDQVRYFLLREVPFGQDGSYSDEAIVTRINTDLANELGNLAQRSLSMVAKNLGGVVPEPGSSVMPTPSCWRRLTGCWIGCGPLRPSGNASGAGGDLADARRRQQVLFDTAAVGAAQERVRGRPGEVSHHALHHLRGGSHRSAIGAARHAGVRCQDAGPARPTRRPAGVQRSGHPARAGDPTAAAHRGFPALPAAFRSRVTGTRRASGTEVE
ncbi:methionyl-tRNA synthetase [Mycobacterium kansasii 824]|nr:methionyl-tRNA synthetase [Mycobacterium kansasii 824]